MIFYEHPFNERIRTYLRLEHLYARMDTLRSPKTLTGPALGVPSLTFRAWYEAKYGLDAWEAGAQGWNRWAADNFGFAMHRFLVTAAIGPCVDMDATVADLVRIEGARLTAIVDGLTPDGLRLTPAYDLVATALYPEYRQLALARADPALKQHGSHFHLASEQVGVSDHRQHVIGNAAVFENAHGFADGHAQRQIVSAHFRLFKRGDARAITQRLRVARWHINGNASGFNRAHRACPSRLFARVLARQGARARVAMPVIAGKMHPFSKVDLHIKSGLLYEKDIRHSVS